MPIDLRSLLKALDIAKRERREARKSLSLFFDLVRDGERERNEKKKIRCLLSASPTLLPFITIDSSLSLFCPHVLVFLPPPPLPARRRRGNQARARARARENKQRRARARERVFERLRERGRAPLCLLLPLPSFRLFLLLLLLRRLRLRRRKRKPWRQPRPSRSRRRCRYVCLCSRETLLEEEERAASVLN